MRVTLFHSGFAVYTIGLANALSELATVTVVQPEALNAVSRRLARETVQIHTFKKPALRRQLSNLGAMRKAFDAIRETAPDVVHVQEMFDYSYDLTSMFRNIGPLVTTIHDVTPHPGDGDAAPGLQYSKAFGIWRSLRLIVHTQGMRSDLARRFRVDIGIIDVIPHGELGSLYLDFARRSGAFHRPRDPHTILFFGRIFPYKGLSVLLEAFRLAKDEVPNAKLLICGRGSDLDAHAALIASIPGIEVRAGYIKEEDVAGIFEQSAITVLPYLEASQSGVSAISFPVGSVIVASKVGGLAEQIIDGETGVLVSPNRPVELANAIVRLLKNSTELEKIRHAAISYSERELNWARIAEDTLATYRSAVSRE